MAEFFSIVAILSGAMVKDKSGRWRTTTFDDPGDLYGPVGDRLRVIAGSYLYKKNPEIKFILLGGRGQLAGVRGAPAVSQIMKHELKELGVPAKRIVTEEKSGTTFEQLVALSKIIQRGKYDKTTIISNEYHLSRIRAMIKHDNVLNHVLHDTVVLSAEKIVMRKHHKKWAGIIAKTYAEVAMKRRIRLEKKGIAEIKLGTYRYS